LVVESLSGGLRVAEMSHFPREMLDAAWDIARMVEARAVARERAIGSGGGSGSGGGRVEASAGQGGRVKAGGGGGTSAGKGDAGDGQRRGAALLGEVERSRRVAMIAQRVAMICDSSTAHGSSGAEIGGREGAGGVRGGVGGRDAGAVGEKDMEAKVNGLKRLQAQAGDVFTEPRACA